MGGAEFRGSREIRVNRLLSNIPLYLILLITQRIGKGFEHEVHVPKVPAEFSLLHSIYLTRIGINKGCNYAQLSGHFQLSTLEENGENNSGESQARKERVDRPE